MPWTLLRRGCTFSTGTGTHVVRTRVGKNCFRYFGRRHPAGKHTAVRPERAKKERTDQRRAERSRKRKKTTIKYQPEDRWWIIVCQRRICRSLKSKRTATTTTTTIIIVIFTRRFYRSWADERFWQNIRPFLGRHQTGELRNNVEIDGQLSRETQLGRSLQA